MSLISTAFSTSSTLPSTLQHPSSSSPRRVTSSSASIGLEHTDLKPTPSGSLISSSTIPAPSSATSLKPNTSVDSPTNPPVQPDRTMPPPSAIPRKRKLAPHPLSSPSPSVSPTPDPPEDEDDEYAPVIGIAPKKSRSQAHPAGTAGAGGVGGGGRASGSNGRAMSREALRKANHSMIERRRREKINAALGDLRDMVPGLGDQTKGGEFKLETVAYMRQLKATIVELEARAGSTSSSAVIKPTARSKSETTSEETVSTTTDHSPPKYKTLPPLPAFPQPKQNYFGNSKTPPSPSLSPDPNETEPECNLPPAFTLANRQVANVQLGSNHGVHPTSGTDIKSPGTPTIASLLHTANSDHRQLGRSTGHAGWQASNPTLYLPFPTPSPTSPFLTYHTSSSSSASSGPPEPSPFLAPLQNISLFGGALNLDNNQPDKGKDMRPEEAANLLLAFSSPDVLRPVAGLQMTPKMIPVENDLAVGTASAKRSERRGTLDSEDFVLDGGLVCGGGKGGARNGVIGKTARDILKM